jgi:Male specific sperm protein
MSHRVFLIPLIIRSKMNLITLKKLQTNLSKTKNNRQEVQLKLFVSLLAFGPQMGPCGPQMGPCGPQMGPCGPQVLAPDFTILLVTFSSDFYFASNLRRSSSFFMVFHLILKNNEILTVT